MKQKILVQDGLEAIKFGLQNKGYKIVNNALNEVYDVFIYEADGHDINSYNQMTNLSNQNNNSIFLVNAKGKTLAQIDYMIRNKYYSSLF